MAIVPSTAKLAANSLATVTPQTKREVAPLASTEEVKIRCARSGCQCEICHYPVTEAQTKAYLVAHGFQEWNNRMYCSKVCREQAAGGAFEK